MKVIDIAIGVMICKNQVLLSQRKKDQSFSGKWEFPGGKVEQDEKVENALIREFTEEIGIKTQSWVFLMDVPWTYQKKNDLPLRIVLHTYYLLVDEKPIEASLGNEQQRLKWQDIATLQESDFPEANAAIIESIKKL